MAGKASFFENQISKNKPQPGLQKKQVGQKGYELGAGALKDRFEAISQGAVVENVAGGWGNSGHTGGGHTGHDGKYTKREGGEAVVFKPKPTAPPSKKSLSDLP